MKVANQRKPEDSRCAGVIKSGAHALVNPEGFQFGFNWAREGSRCQFGPSAPAPRSYTHG